MTTARGRSIARDLAPALLLCALAIALLAGLPWPCPMKTVLGVPCPMCGMTRAARLVLRGDLAGATRMHPLWIVVLPACGAFAVGECVGFARTRQWGTTGRSPIVKWGAAAVLALAIAVWIARFFGAFGGPVP